jgi:hypothetical protein
MNLETGRPAGAAGRHRPDDIEAAGPDPPSEPHEMEKSVDSALIQRRRASPACGATGLGPQSGETGTRGTPGRCRRPIYLSGLPHQMHDGARRRSMRAIGPSSCFGVSRSPGRNSRKRAAHPQCAQEDEERDELPRSLSWRSSLLWPSPGRADAVVPRPLPALDVASSATIPSSWRHTTTSSLRGGSSIVDKADEFGLQSIRRSGGPDGLGPLLRGRNPSGQLAAPLNDHPNPEPTARGAAPSRMPPALRSRLKAASLRNLADTYRVMLVTSAR